MTVQSIGTDILSKLATEALLPWAEVPFRSTQVPSERISRRPQTSRLKTGMRS